MRNIKETRNKFVKDQSFIENKLELAGRAVNESFNYEHHKNNLIFIFFNTLLTRLLIALKTGRCITDDNIII